jgi:hypothetical protein
MTRQYQNRKWLAGSVILLFIFQIPVFSQMTPRALGMGGAYSALARGVHAPDWNPANLGMPDNPGFSMSFLSVGTQISNNSFTQGMYNKYIGKYLTQGDVEDILSAIPDNGLFFGVRGTLRIISFSAGHFAMTIGGDFSGYGNMEKTLFELMFRGNELYKTYDFDDIDGGGEGVGLIGFSYGRPIPADFAEVFTIGGTLNFLYGIGYAKIEKSGFKLRFDDDGMNMNGDYMARTATGSLGWSLNVGSAAKLNKKLTVDFSLMNLIGNIPWDRNVEQVTGYIHADTLAILSTDDDDAAEDSSWTVDGHRFSGKLPIQMRMGAMYEEGDFVITADYSQGFKNSSWMNTTPEFTFGTEWRKVKWLPLRMGVLLGGRFGFGTSFGLGIRPGGFIWDIGVMNRGFITPNSSKGLILATEIGMVL